jgi:hypothetical protein
MPTHDLIDAAKLLAEKFIERSTALKYRGKKRDAAALDYFCGAATMAELNGDTALSEHLGWVLAVMIAVRGYTAVLELRGISYLHNPQP